MDFNDIIGRFKDRKILVAGDIILDHYIWGRVNRISPEAPVPVVEVSRESFMLGGVANVAHNIVALGGKATIVGITGEDAAGKMISGLLSDYGVDCSSIFVSNRPTTVKTRVIAHSQQVVRFDREDSNYVDGRVLRGVLEQIQAAIPHHDAVIVSDYKKGMISEQLVREIVKAAKTRKMFVAVDPKVGHFHFYKGVSMITPNVMEASSGSGIEIRDDKTLLRAGKVLQKNLGCRAVLITRGEQGMSLFNRNQKVLHIPTVARKVYDVTGAGDTVISAFTIAFASGATMEQASVIANHAAGIVVGEVGTAVATQEELLQSFESKA